MSSVKAVEFELLELGLEQVNRLADAAYQTIQRFYDWQLTISEAYREDLLFLHIHLFSFYGEFKISPSSHVMEDNRAGQLRAKHSQATVLVWVRNGT